ncbi:hypothetical protein ACFYW8_44470 [Streptomyces sp. NPDC002742]|jgi:hypothetical protein|uniref:hypothetical protein n=1 Tax=unclassified Streptomyces TaxID=2593676 RepID=UPI003438AF00
MSDPKLPSTATDSLQEKNESADPLRTEVHRLWFEALGETADPTVGFLANGGDSFHAVLFATALFEATGQEIDYFDLLEADGAETVYRLVTASAGR